MRADRLVAIVLLLQVHGQLTARSLADRLETSERTIRRDLEALSAAGVPVYAQRGRGGGWALVGRHRIDLSGLTVDEARALFLVTGPGMVEGLGGSGSGLGAEVDAALRKLQAALPEPIRRQVEAARSAVLVDQGRWGEKAPRPQHLEALRRAVVEGVQVDVAYARPGGSAESRRLHPHGLVNKRGVWYLLATSVKGLRTYRVDRFHAVAATVEKALRPEGFDLAAAWGEVQRALPARYTLAVEVLVELDTRHRLEVAVGSWYRIEDRRPLVAGEVAALTIWFPSVAVAAGELVRFVDGVEVLAPTQVRDELARLGDRLTARYGTRQDAGALRSVDARG